MIRRKVLVGLHRSIASSCWLVSRGRAPADEVEEHVHAGSARRKRVLPDSGKREAKVPYLHTQGPVTIVERGARGPESSSFEALVVKLGAARAATSTWRQSLSVRERWKLHRITKHQRRRATCR
jgi:hypothetical protein